MEVAAELPQKISYVPPNTGVADQAAARQSQDDATSRSKPSALVPWSMDTKAAGRVDLPTLLGPQGYD